MLPTKQIKPDSCPPITSHHLARWLLGGRLAAVQPQPSPRVPRHSRNICQSHFLTIVGLLLLRILLHVVKEEDEPEEDAVPDSDPRADEGVHSLEKALDLEHNVEDNVARHADCEEEKDAPLSPPIERHLKDGPDASEDKRRGSQDDERSQEEVISLNDFRQRLQPDEKVLQDVNAGTGHHPNPVRQAEAQPDIPHDSVTNSDCKSSGLGRIGALRGGLEL